MSDQDKPAGESGRQRGGSAPTRREFMIGGGAAIGGMAIGAAGAASPVHRARPTDAQARLVDDALAAAASSPAQLSDIKHVVILMQENRSFDHYFGTLSGVRGFSDPAVRTQTVSGKSYPIFDQFGYQPGTGADGSGYLQPFRLLSDPPLEDGQTTNDIGHSWAVQHQSWNGGALDSFVRAHVRSDGVPDVPVTMGYFTRQDLAFYYALADAFTVCDGYFCSVLGPTDPNRLMLMSATIDPAGSAGGPVVQTFSDRLAEYGKLHWETMPQRLLAAGVSWKVYNDPTGLLGLSPLPYFAAYNNPFSITGLELITRALTPTYPGNFAADVKAGRPLRSPGSSRRSPSASTRRRRRSTASTSSSRSSARSSPTPRCGRRRCSSSFTTKTAGSSTTSRRPPRRPARPVNT